MLNGLSANLEMCMDCIVFILDVVTCFCACIRFCIIFFVTMLKIKHIHRNK